MSSTLCERYENEQILQNLWNGASFRKPTDIKGKPIEETTRVIARFEMGDVVDAACPPPALFLEYSSLGRIVALLLSDTGKEYFHLNDLERIVLILPSDNCLIIKGGGTSTSQENDLYTAYIVVHSVFPFPEQEIRTYKRTSAYAVWKSGTSNWSGVIPENAVHHRVQLSPTADGDLVGLREQLASNMDIMLRDGNRTLHTLMSDEQKWQALLHDMGDEKGKVRHTTCWILRLRKGVFVTVNLQLPAQSLLQIGSATVMTFDEAQTDLRTPVCFVDFFEDYHEQTDLRFSEFKPCYPLAIESVTDDVVTTAKRAALPLCVGLIAGYLVAKQL